MVCVTSKLKKTKQGEFCEVLLSINGLCYESKLKQNEKAGEFSVTDQSRLIIINGLCYEQVE
jgi:hypothetical protein